jgi:hypothetical protein
VVVDVGLTDREPLADVEVNMPGVIEILPAPVLAQLSMLLAPALMLAGMAAKAVIIGTEPDVGGGDVVLESEPVDEPPQLASTVHASSVSASVCSAAHRWLWVRTTGQEFLSFIREASVATALIVGGRRCSRQFVVPKSLNASRKSPQFSRVRRRSQTGSFAASPETTAIGLSCPHGESLPAPGSTNFCGANSRGPHVGSPEALGALNLPPLH